MLLKDRQHWWFYLCCGDAPSRTKESPPPHRPVWWYQQAQFESPCLNKARLLSLPWKQTTGVPSSNLTCSKNVERDWPIFAILTAILVYTGKKVVICEPVLENTELQCVSPKQTHNRCSPALLMDIRITQAPILSEWDEGHLFLSKRTASLGCQRAELAEFSGVNGLLAEKQLGDPLSTVSQNPD